MRAILRAQRSGGVAALQLHRGEAAQAQRQGGNSKRRRSRAPQVFELPELRDDEETFTLILGLLTAGAFL